MEEKLPEEVLCFVNTCNEKLKTFQIKTARSSQRKRSILLQKRRGRIVLVRGEDMQSRDKDRLEVIVRHRLGDVVSQIRVQVFTEDGDAPIAEQKLAKSRDVRHATIFRGIPSDYHLKVRFAL